MKRIKILNLFQGLFLLQLIQNNTLKSKVVLCFLFINYGLIGQPEIEWEKNFGGTASDAAYSVRQTIDGGYIVAGSSKSNNLNVGENNGDYDYWIIKLDQSGNLEWEKNYGGSGVDIANSIEQTLDGGFIVAGTSTSNDGDVGENKGRTDCWIVKIDNLGNLQWENNFGGSSTDIANSIRQTTDGGYIVAGGSSSTDGDVGGNNGIPYLDYWIIKLDTFGNLQWGEIYGGSKSDNAFSVQQTTDNGYIIAGSSSSSDGDVGGNKGSSDYWIIKLDQSGNLEWEKNYGGSEYDRPCSIQQTVVGGYIVAGLSTSNDGDVGGNNGFYSADTWLVKLDEFGNLEWEENYGTNVDEWAYTMQQTSDGGYVIAGESFRGGNGLWDWDSFVMKVDESGNLETVKNYGGTSPEAAHSIQETTDGNYIVAGYSKSNDEDVGGNNGDFDYWILKLNSECLSNWTITSNTPFQNIYQICGAITTNGFLTIEQNQEIKYCANRVTLSEGFSAKAGADFKVRNSECR